MWNFNLHCEQKQTKKHDSGWWKSGTGLKHTEFIFVLFAFMYMPGPNIHFLVDAANQQ